MTGDPNDRIDSIDRIDRITAIRRELAALGLTQPQYWILRCLSPDDLGAGFQGRTLEEVDAVLREYLLPGDDLSVDTDALATRGLITRDAGARLHLTSAGRAAHARVKGNLPAIRARLEAETAS